MANVLLIVLIAPLLLLCGCLDLTSQPKERVSLAGGNIEQFLDSSDFYSFNRIISVSNSLVVVGRGTKDRGILLSKFDTSLHSDSKFGNVGIATIPELTSAHGLAFVENNKLAVAGVKGFPEVLDYSIAPFPKACIGVFDMEGTPHSTFGTGGVRCDVFPEKGALKTIVENNFGWFVGGTVLLGTSQTRRYGIAGFSNANPLPSFASGGVLMASIAYPNSGNCVYGMATQNDGKILILTDVDDTSFVDAALIRLLPDGFQDPAFGTNGVARLKVPNNGRNLSARLDCNETTPIKLDSSGNIFVVLDNVVLDNTVANNSIIQKYMPNGNLDLSFGVSGSSAYSFSPPNEYNRTVTNEMLLQLDGSILIGGSWVSIERSQPVIMRINSMGKLDTGFGDLGKIAINFNTHKSVGYSLVQLPDSSIVLAGSSESKGFLIRIKPSM